MWLYSVQIIPKSSILAIGDESLGVHFCFPVLCFCHFDYDKGGTADEQAAHNYKHLIIAVLG